MARDDQKDESPEQGSGSESEAARDFAAEDIPTDAEAPLPKARSKSARRRAREERTTRRDEQPQRAKAGAPKSQGASFALIGALALAAGVAAGWFGHEAQAKARLDSGPTPVGSDGPCEQWRRKLCSSTGDESAACQQAKDASELLTAPICEDALAAVPATLAKVKAARAPCDNLINKACSDLPKDSSTCKMVRERTGMFPVDRCKEMLEHYAEVIEELRTLDAQGGPPEMGVPPQGMPPQGMPPGAHP